MTTNPPAIDEKAREAIRMLAVTIDNVEKADGINLRCVDRLFASPAPPPPPEGARPDVARTVREAQVAGVCRICGLKDRDGPGMPFILNFGREHAHEKCLAASPPPTPDRAWEKECKWTLKKNGLYDMMSPSGKFFLGRCEADWREDMKPYDGLHGRSQHHELLVALSKAPPPPDVTDTGKEKVSAFMQNLHANTCVCGHHRACHTDDGHCTHSSMCVCQRYKHDSAAGSAPQPVTSEGKGERGKEWLPEGMESAWSAERRGCVRHPERDYIVQRDSHWRTHYEALEREMAELRSKK